MTQRALHVAQILWPAFVFAALLEMLVFAWVDPGQLVIGAWHPDARTVYSVAFLAFWGLIALAAGVSQWLMAAGSAPPRHASHARRRSARHA